MGAFNVVTIKRVFPCTRCGDTGDIQVQFKYGDTQQHHYSLGDRVTWGGNDIGVPSGSLVEILATPEYCQRCGLEVPGDYVLFLDDGQITGYRLATPEDIERNLI